MNNIVQSNFDVQYDDGLKSILFTSFTSSTKVVPLIGDPTLITTLDNVDLNQLNIQQQDSELLIPFTFTSITGNTLNINLNPIVQTYSNQNITDTFNNIDLDDFRSVIVNQTSMYSIDIQLNLLLNNDPIDQLDIIFQIYKIDSNQQNVLLLENNNLVGLENDYELFVTLNNIHLTNIDNLVFLFNVKGVSSIDINNILLSGTISFQIK